MSKYIQILSKYALFTIAAEKKGPQGATSILFSFHVKVLHSFKAKKRGPQGAIILSFSSCHLFRSPV